MANTLAYYDTAKIAAIISLIVQASGARKIKGDNLKVVWAEFLSLSLVVLLRR